VQRFNDVGAWPVSIGHPCIGCTEPEILFKKPIAEKVQIHEPTPFDSYAPVDLEKGKGPDPLTTGVTSVPHHLWSYGVRRRAVAAAHRIGAAEPVPLRMQCRVALDTMQCRTG